MNAEVVIEIDEARDVLMVQNNAIVSTENVGPAALALGLDLESIDMTQFMEAAGGSFARGGGGEGSAGSGQGGGFGGGGQGRGQPSPEMLERMQSLRAEVASGAISQDSMRSALQAMGGRAAGGGAGGASGAAGANGDSEGAARRETRPAAVFVVAADDTLQPRLVQMGIGDWDNTEIVSGVEEGDMLAIVGPAQLQAQQEAFLEQMRGRMSGSNPFGGGVPGGGRGFPGGGRGR
jgi:HlyD family secretion protein